MLFVSPARRERILAALRNHHPDVVPIVNALSDNTLIKSEFDRLLHGIGSAWLANDKGTVCELCERMMVLVKSEELLDLGRANQTLGVVLAFDFAKDMLPSHQRAQMAELLVWSAQTFLTIRNGNPHIVTNNWYMLTHGACCLAAMAADGELDTRGKKLDCSHLERWALHRSDAFCQHFGNAGLYHEGSGYICYTLSMLAPLIVALRNKRGYDLTEENLGLRNTLHSMLISVANAKTDQGIKANMLEWNDTERHAGSLNPYLPLLLISDAQKQGALLRQLRHTIGSSGENKWECCYKGLPLALAIWPLDLEPAEPQEKLRTWCIDNRHGLGHWRSSWDDDKAVVLGWYARTTHASPGHSQDDAGSVRLMGLGQTWICSGGQARGRSIWQSVLTHAQQEDRPSKHPHAYVFSKNIEAQQGCIGIEMRHALSAYSERYIAWNNQHGYPITMAILDLLTDHRKQPKPYTWNLSLPAELNVSLDASGRGFKAVNAEGKVFQGYFLLDQPDHLELCTMPPSRRTFSGGNSVDYPGDYYISAQFHNRPEIKILVLLSLAEQEEQGATRTALIGRDLLLANGELWKDPFAEVILPEVDFTTMKPNLQLYPNGQSN